MKFIGIRRVFSTQNEVQYTTIGAFWDEMSKIYGIEKLMGLGCNWTDNSIEYVMALKQGIIENANYADIAIGNYNTKYNKKSFLASLHSFWFKYNIPIMFMPDPKFSALFIKKYFEYYLKNYLR